MTRLTQFNGMQHSISPGQQVALDGGVAGLLGSFNQQHSLLLNAIWLLRSKQWHPWCAAEMARRDACKALSINHHHGLCSVTVKPCCLLAHIR